ncbi:MAG: DNA/RNA non-specific endonuclease [Lachnospiraceae bacterium]|nr:DNA/RNA non-specific endonuclease [Lachnospiraceae bacterium]
MIWYGVKTDTSKDAASVSEETSTEVSFFNTSSEENFEETTVSVNGESVPKYSGEPYYVLNNNIPEFSYITDESFEDYGELDSLDRCTKATACLGTDTAPAYGEERGDIYFIKPTGWRSERYECVDGESVYNRCHLIAWMLGAENANEKNLVTGTRYMNLEMLEYEIMVDDYIEETENHVMYSVEPYFVGDDAVCRGLIMQGFSVEDEGEGISYNVFFYNVQPGIEIDYSTGATEYTGVFLDTDSDAVIID